MKRDYKTYYFYKHQHKADRFRAALRQFGWRADNTLHYTGAAFFDIDIMERIEILNGIHAYGVKIFVYPHTARPNVVYAWKEHRPHQFTTAQFVSGPGHIEVAQTIGYPHPIHDIGWSFCEKRNFTPHDVVRNVLFGPIHPNANGWLCKEDKDTNRNALERLKKASKEMGFKITVRYLYKLSDNGFPHEEDPEITYIAGRPDGTFEEIDAADLVVGTQTFAYMAIARGVPTLMMDEWLAPKAGNSEESFAFIDGWDSIKHLMMYPLDLNTTNDVVALIQRATTSDEEIKAWRRSMIGDSFNPRKFADIVKSYFE